MRTNADNLAKDLEWYNTQLTDFKNIVPGYDSVRKLTGYIKAWQNIVSGCDTPEKLENYIKAIENGVKPINAKIDTTQSFFELWNNNYVQHCREIGNPIFPFASEQEYIKEESELLKDCMEYGKNNALDPIGLKDFYLWLKSQGMVLPAKIEVIL